ncbi:MAG: hypothetical protein ACI4PC_09275 [Oscillospiraceae bacterium]
MVELKKDTPTVHFKKHWQFCVGSPHATYALRRDYFEQLRQVHEELHIQRVRFHGIFCDDMHTYHKMSDFLPIPGASRYSERSFRWCGVAYDNVLDAGMQPFVELSFMPRHLARRNRRGLFYYKPVIAPPRDLEAWYAYVQDFIRFLLARYGAGEVRQWYFEVWNEPDLRLPFFAGSREDYFQLYAATVRAIKDVDSQLRVGGPSTSGSKWVPELLAYCREKGLPIDFVTTHEYAGDPLGGLEDGGKDEKMKLSMDLLAAVRQRKTLRHDRMLDLYRAVSRVENVTDTLNADALIRFSRRARQDAGGLPLFYTEWNMCASFSAPCNDTRMQAAYDLHAILGTQDTIDGSSLWCFTDLFEELHPFPEEFHGGFGLLTQSGIKKPAYHALQMLTDAGEERFLLPETERDAEVAAFRSSEGVQVLLSRLSFHPTGEQREVRVRVELGRPPRRVTLRRIDGEHGDPLGVWEDMGAPQVPTPEELDFLRAKSAVTPEDVPYTYGEDGWMELQVRLGDNDILFLEIT